MIFHSNFLQKAYEEGIYADTPGNRKLNRVGKPYNYKEETTKKEEVSKDFRSEDKAFLADIESKIEPKDKTEFNRLKNSLVEGRNLYNSGLNPSGKKMSEGELAAVTKSIDSTKQKLSKLVENKKENLTSKTETDSFKSQVDNLKKIREDIDKIPFKDRSKSNSFKSLQNSKKSLEKVIDSKLYNHSKIESVLKELGYTKAKTSKTDVAGFSNISEKGYVFFVPYKLDSYGFEKNDVEKIFKELKKYDLAESLDGLQINLKINEDLKKIQ